MEGSKPYFALQNSHRDPKEFLQHLQTTGACALKKVRQAWPTTILAKRVFHLSPQFSPCKQVGRREEDGGVRIKNATLLVFTIKTSLCGTLL